MRSPILLAVAVALLGAGCGDLATQTADDTTTSSAAARGPTRAPGQYGGPDNLLPNPSFEQGILPWAYNGAGLLQLTNTHRKVGRTALRVTATNGGTYGAHFLGAVVSPARGDVFEFTAWLKADRPKNVAMFMQASGTTEVETFAMKTVRIGREWTQARVRGRVTRRDRGSLYLILQVRSSIAIGDAFYVDGVTLEHTASALP